MGWKGRNGATLKCPIGKYVKGSNCNRELSSTYSLQQHLLLTHREGQLAHVLAIMVSEFLATEKEKTVAEAVDAVMSRMEEIEKDGPLV